jgi:hypothetical protein
MEAEKRNAGTIIYILGNDHDVAPSSVTQVSLTSYPDTSGNNHKSVLAVSKTPRMHPFCKPHKKRKVLQMPNVAATAPCLMASSVVHCATHGHILGYSLY